MANDAQSQTIPSWVADDSFEVQTKVTYTINSGHPSPLSSTQFKTFWKGLYDNVVVRGGKIQDNTHMNGKYLVDNQKPREFFENLYELHQMSKQFKLINDNTKIIFVRCFYNLVSNKKFKVSLFYNHFSMCGAWIGER